MILAGHETTATTLFWSLYLLALDPASRTIGGRGAGCNRERRARSRAAEIYPCGGR